MEFEEEQHAQSFFTGNDGGDDTKERRRYPRKPVRLYVKLSYDQISEQKMSRDISLSGIFIEGVDNIAPGKEVQLSLPFFNHVCHIKMRGKVVRATKDGIGIHFDIFSIDIE